MRAFTVVATLLAATFVGATLQCSESDELCGSFKSLDERDDSQPQPLTNAQRLAQGLAPAAPKGRDTAKRATASQRKRAPTPSQRKRAPAPSQRKRNPPTKTIRGIIQVLNADDGNAPLGYISKNSFNHAQYRYEVGRSEALIVTATVPDDATSATGINFKVENSDIPNFPYAGLVQGRDSTSSNIAPGSFNYGYFASTNLTPAGSTPQNVGNSYTAATKKQRTSESAVWTVDLKTGKISVQWINTDGSSPTTHLFTQSEALYFGGDKDKFKTRYPAPVTCIELQLVQLEC